MSSLTDVNSQRYEHANDLRNAELYQSYPCPEDGCCPCCCYVCYPPESFIPGHDWPEYYQ